MREVVLTAEQRTGKAGIPAGRVTKREWHRIGIWNERVMTNESIAGLPRGFGSRFVTSWPT